MLLVLSGAAILSAAAGTALKMGRIFPSERVAPLAAGAVAPAFELKNLSGGVVALEQFSGRPIVLMFWGSG